MMKRDKIGLLSVLFLFWQLGTSVPLMAARGHKVGGFTDTGRRDSAVERALNCVEASGEGAGAVGWKDICYMNQEKKGVVLDGAYQPPKRGLLSKRTQAMESDLDQWEAAVADHRKRASEKPWAEVENRHQDEQFINKSVDEFNPSEKFARENAQAVEVKKHQLDVGTEYFFAKYEEPDVMEQHGKLWGMNGAYTYRPAKSDWLHNSFLNTFMAEGMLASGKFNYEAEADAQSGLQVKDKEDFMLDVRGLVGKEYVFPSRNGVHFYGGVGYRYLNDDDNGDLVFVQGKGNFYGYERESNYFYLPLGFEYSKRFQQGWALKTRAEYDWFLFGRQVSHLSDGNVHRAGQTPNEDATNDQKRGFGMRASVQIVKEMSRLNFLLEPFVRYWHIEDSEVETVMADNALTPMLEPENKTVELGLKAGVQF